MEKLKMFQMNSLAFVFILTIGLCSASLPQPGKWTLKLNESNQYDAIVKNVFADTKLYVKINCMDPDGDGVDPVAIGWVLRETVCWNEYTAPDLQGSIKDMEVIQTYYRHPDVYLPLPEFNSTTTKYERYAEVEHACDGPIILAEAKPSNTQHKVVKGDLKSDDSNSALDVNHNPASGVLTTKMPQFNITTTGDYIFVIRIHRMDGQLDKPFTAIVEVEMKGPYGYLSASDWPFLPFYGIMCAAYIIMGITWLILCARYWREILRVQFWIGGVIFLGMLEKAMFLAEYSNMNSSGESTDGLFFAAEVVSCAKRTLARMLVIIVSLGFGIVKPRLGATMHRVMAIGGLYFGLAVIEAYIRINRAMGDLSQENVSISIPLAILDSSICWWVFSALVATTRTLRLRRNVVKLSLYRHFTNTLAFSVLASVIFMLISMKYHRWQECLKDWRDLWFDDAFWHILFSVILVVIMFLWRPSQNNQRYAFTPLLDNEEDDDSEGEEGDDDNDTFYEGKITQRTKFIKKENGGGKYQTDSSEVEDPLKWIEENIPEAADNPLPVLDSDEEIETSRLEISKMQ